MVFKNFNPEAEKEAPSIVYKGTLSQLLGTPEEAQETKTSNRASILDNVLLSDTTERQ